MRPDLFVRWNAELREYIALGLMERDGVVIGVGFAAALLALVSVTLALAGATDAVRYWFFG